MIFITFGTPLFLVMNLILMCHCLIKVILFVTSIDSSLFVPYVGSWSGYLRYNKTSSSIHLMLATFFIGNRLLLGHTLFLCFLLILYNIM